MKSLATDDWFQHPIHGGSLKIGIALPVLMHAGPVEETKSGVVIARDVLVIRQLDRQWKQSVGFARELPGHIIDAQLGNRRLVRVEVGQSKISEPQVHRPGFLNQISLDSGLPAAPICVGTAAVLAVLRVVIQFEDAAVCDGPLPLAPCEEERLPFSRKRVRPFPPYLTQGELNRKKHPL